MALADVAVDVSEPYVREYENSALPAINERLDMLKHRALSKLVTQGVLENSVEYACYLNLQYSGSDTTLMILRPENEDYIQAFIEEHKREFAFTLDVPVLIAGVRVRATSKSMSEAISEKSPYMLELREMEQSHTASLKPRPFSTNPVFFDEVGDYSEVPLYRLDELLPGMKVDGPAIILDATQTIILHPQNTARILRSHVM